MNKTWKKFTACTTAAITLALSVGSLSASAITPTITPNFGFEYSVYTERIAGTNQVKVTFHTTKNPGISGLGITFLCDSSCTPVSVDKSQTSMATGIGYDRKQGSKVYFTSSYGSADDSFNYDNLDVTVIYNVTGDSTQKHEFSVGLTGIFRYEKVDENTYRSIGELYTEKDPEYKELVNETSVSVGVSADKKALVGDLNGDKTINSLDVNCLQRVMSYATAGKYKVDNSSQITLSELNNAICDYPTLWSDMPGLICADIANTDGNNVINKNDSTELLNYIATIGASLTSKNAYIGKPVTVSIVM